MVLITAYNVIPLAHHVIWIPITAYPATRIKIYYFKVISVDASMDIIGTSCHKIALVFIIKYLQNASIHAKVVKVLINV